MNADWEKQQELLIRNAECLPDLDVALKRRVLMGAAVAKKTAVRQRRLAIAASVLLLVSSGTYGVTQMLTPQNNAPMADTDQDKPDTTDDGLYDQAIDRQAERSQVFPASMFP